MTQEEAEKLAKQIEEFANTGKEPEGLNLPDEIKTLLKEGIGLLAVATKSPLMAHMLMQFGMEDGKWAIERVKEICHRINNLHEAGQAIQLTAYLYENHFHAGTESQGGEDDLESLWLAANALNIQLSRKLSEHYKAKGFTGRQRAVMSQVLQNLALSFLDDPKHNSSLALRKRQTQAGETKDEKPA